MAVYVLIHGAWHGAWCWKKVAPLLEERGHTVVAPDLPGRGSDSTPLAELTLQAYVDRVCGVLDAQPEPAVLIGHSMGGAIITQTAEERPDKIRALVYLCAFLPRDGETVLGLAASEPASLVTQNLVVSDDQRSATLRGDSLRDAFYGDCSDEDAAWAASLLVPEALAPATTPLCTTEANWGRVPRIYIETLQDRALPPPLQQRMYTASPCERVITMDTSHSPFLSAPQQVASHLLSV